MSQFVCLGFNVDKEKGYVTGLAMMHDLFVAILRENGYIVKAISLNSRYENPNAQVGDAGVKRYFEYVSIIWKVIKAFIVQRHVVFYFNPSTAKTGFYRDVLLVAFAKLLGHQVLMQQFGALFETFRNSLNKRDQRILNWAYNKTDMLIVEGENAKRQYSFIKKQEKIKIVPNGLPELKRGIKKEPKSYQEGSTFNMFFMNNMIVSKGYMDVLKAIDILVNERQRDVKCVFAGKYMLTKEECPFKTVDEAQMWFDGFIEEKGLEDRVVYYQSIFDENKINEFKNAHVFLLPSYYMFEGQPTAILEALSYGCVPVVTRYRLIPDMVNDECGVFVGSKSPNEIADAISNLMDDTSYYNQLSKNAFDRFQKNFTQMAYAEKIIKIIEELR